MKRTIRTLATLVGATLAFAQPAHSQQADLSIKAQSAYEVRGLEIADKFTLQPKALVSGSKIYGLGLVSFSPQDGSVHDVVAEVGYNIPVKNNQLSVLWSGAIFPENGWSHEVAIQVSRNGKITPSLLVVRDLHANKGLYAQLGASTQTSVLGLPLNLETAVAYNDNYYRDESRISHAELGASTTLHAGKIALTPSVSYGKRLDRNGGEVIGGLRLGFHR